jgi:formyl-CoA transferase
VEEILHPELGMLKQVGNPVQMDGLQRRSIRRPPPSLGEHTLELLSELGLSEGAIKGLIERKVVFQK